MLKFQNTGAKVTGVLLANAYGEGGANVPEVPLTTGLIQEVTSVAVPAELVLMVTPKPEKPMLPVIKAACRVCAKVMTTAATVVRRISFFIGVGG
jgi:hypothetical protein